MNKNTNPLIPVSSEEESGISASESVSQALRQWKTRHLMGHDEDDVSGGVAEKDAAPKRRRAGAR